MTDNTDYTSSGTANVIAFLLCGVLYYQLIILHQEHVFIDYLNLAFHEAGHLFLSAGNQTLHIIGGTLGQLFFPVLISVIFYVKGQKFSSMIISFWFFENFYNIAQYVNDAADMELPLVGGFGGVPVHDWNYLLGKFGVMDRCHIYADRLYFLGKAGMSAAMLAAFIFLIMDFSKKEAAE